MYYSVLFVVRETDLHIIYLQIVINMNIKHTFVTNEADLTPTCAVELLAHMYVLSTDTACTSKFPFMQKL